MSEPVPNGLPLSDMAVETRIDLEKTPRVLVIGGARSGKSRFAEAIATAQGTPCTYIATAEARDAEMKDRIAAHRDRRGRQWQTVEAPVHLPQALVEAAGDENVVLVDCLTLWLSNMMLADLDCEAAGEALVAALGAPNRVVLVANEVGLGIVPENALARRFRDAAGLLNQQVAAAVDAVVLVAAGLPLVMKSNCPEGAGRH